MSQDRVHKPQLLKRKESRSGIELRSFCLPAYRRLTARPNRLTRGVGREGGRGGGTVSPFISPSRRDPESECW